MRSFVSKTQFFSKSKFIKSCIIFFVVGSFFSGCTCSKKDTNNDAKNTDQSQQKSEINRPIEYNPKDYQAKPNDTKKAPDYKGIQVNNVVAKDLVNGSGKQVSNTSKVKLSYEMWVYDPKKIANRGLAIASPQVSQEIEIGKSQIVKGFEQGLIGMKVGGKREIIIPANLAYGVKGYKNIPPGSIILVEVSLNDAN